MTEVRYVENEDKEFWFGLDKHLPECEFEKKVRDKQGYEQPMEMFLSKAL